MKNFLEQLLDIFTGGFFNYLGALFRKPFVKRSYSELVKETQSNNIGMMVMTVILLLTFAYFKFSLRNQQ